MNWSLKKIKVAELKEWAKNPRNLTEKGMKDLKKSIEKFGIAEPLVVNSDLTVCGGHGRKKILEELGIKEVDCYLPEKKLTDKQFEELNVRLNKNIGGEWNFDLLANEFNFEDLLDWGFEEEELIGSKEEKLKEESETLKFYKQVHVLLSFHPDKFIEIKDLIEQIKNIGGIEIEQSAN
jgi:ParB-like chromosome segregation protein Spo0J